MVVSTVEDQLRGQYFPCKDVGIAALKQEVPSAGSDFCKCGMQVLFHGC